MNTNTSDLSSQNPGNSNKYDEMKGTENESDGTLYSSKSDNKTLALFALENCVICMSTISVPRKLKCGHIFCDACISQLLKIKPVCSCCGSVQGVITGDQPPGKMTAKTVPSHLSGYTDCGRIDICYEIYPGKQGPEHPEPGKPFDGIKRNAYLPDNPRGRKIVKMLEVAFNRKLIFTIGCSRTTGREGVVVWNICHKTNLDPHSMFGYPDRTYLDRVEEELALKCVTEKDIQN